MAVFLKNNCQFPGCGLTFPKLSNLIQHIEEKHIASDPNELEKQETDQPSSLNLSYILKIFNNESQKEDLDHFVGITRPESPDFAFRDLTVVDSEYEQEDDGLFYSDNDDDNVSVTSDESGYDFFISKSNSHKGNCMEQSLKCPQPSCRRIFRNMNRLKNHTKTVHGFSSKEQNFFHCEKCGKQYKTAKGLRNHRNNQHCKIEVHIHALNFGKEVPTINMDKVKTVKKLNVLTSKQSGFVCDITKIDQGSHSNINKDPGKVQPVQKNPIFSAIKPSSFTVIPECSSLI